MFVYQEHIPNNFLKKYVHKFWYVKTNLRHSREKIFPMPYVFLVVNLGESYKLYKDSDLKKFEVKDDAWISGLQNQYIVIENPEVSFNVGIEFNPGCVHFFTDYPQSDLTNNIPNLSEVFQDSFKSIRKIDKNSPEKLFTELEAILEIIFRYRDQKNVDLVREAIKEIRQDNEIKIEKLASMFNVSQKHLHELFNEQVGISPKKLKDIYKFNFLIDLIGTEKPESWSDIAAKLKYYDQPHFIKTFKSYTGFTPTEYIKILNANDSGYMNFVALDKK